MPVYYKNISYATVYCLFCIGLLLEGKADIAVSDYGITPVRMQFLDYMMHYNEYAGHIYIRNPKETYDMAVYLKPLRKDAWIAVAIFCIFTPILIAIVVIYSK